MGQFEPALRRILWELQDYLPDIVVVGGWVPYLYQRYGGFSDWTGKISLTGEVDVMLPAEAPQVDRRGLAVILRASGFEPIPGTAGAAWQHDPSRGEKIEFLTPNTGTQAHEGVIQPVVGQPEVSAVALDDLRFLARHAGTLTVPIAFAGGPGQTLVVHLPLLGAYVVNKAITFNKRRPHVEHGVIVENPKRAKDLLYLHDVLMAGKDVERQIVRDLVSMQAGMHTAYYVGLNAGSTPPWAGSDTTMLAYKPSGEPASEFADIALGRSPF